MGVTRCRTGQAAALLLVALGLAGQSTAQQAAAEAGEATQPAARVDGEVITVGDVDRVVKGKGAWSVYCRLPNADLTLLNDFRWNELEELVRHRILLREVKAVAAITEARLDELVQDKIREMGGREKLLALVGLLRADESSFVRQLRESLAIAAYVTSTIVPSVAVTDAEVVAAVAERPRDFALKPAVHVRHLLVRVDSVRGELRESPEARLRIEAMHRRAVAPGADFGAIAREVSECPSASRGGDLGFVEEGAMGAAFDKAMAGLLPGQISEPVLTVSGYHVFRLEARREVSAEAVRENARQLMLQDRAAVRLRERVDVLRRKAEVEVLLPPRRQAKTLGAK